MTYKLQEILGGCSSDGAAITIITPVKNCKNGIEEIISQVKSQVGVNKHHLIVDGGSTDGTLEILKNNITNGLQVLVGEDESNIDATNIAFEYVNTDYFQILTVGDSYNSKFFLKKILNFAISSDASIVWGDTLYGDQYLYGASSAEELKIGKTSIDLRTVIAKTDVFKKIGNFNATYKYACDFEWLCIAMKNNYKMMYCNEDVSIRTSADGITANNYLAARKEVEKIIQEYWGYGLNARLYSLRVYIGYWLKKMYAVIR